MPMLTPIPIRFYLVAALAWAVLAVPLASLAVVLRPRLA